MSAHWSDRYMGMPYVPGEFDCAELAVTVRRDVFGENVEIPTERCAGPFGRSAQLAEALGDYGVPTQSPQDGDAVLLIVRGRLQHIGVYCVINGEPWVLHNVSNFGSVVRRRIRELEQQGYKVEGYYKWK